MFFSLFSQCVIDIETKETYMIVEMVENEHLFILDVNPCIAHIHVY